MDGVSPAPKPAPLASNLPSPIDDGAAAHLIGGSIPNLELHSTEGHDRDLATLSATGLVLYIFPKMGRPNEADPPGWDEIPGARGCTQQSCAFRDQHQEFASNGYDVAGLSAQTPEDQLEAATRLQLSFPLLADPELKLSTVLGLPTFEIAGMTLYKRLTLVARGRRIVKVFYPVFPPDENPSHVLEWILSTPRGT
ncbi:MAG: peroxiredoxin [Gaiellales bacterium]